MQSKISLIIPTVLSRPDLLSRNVNSLLAFADEPVQLVIQSNTGSFAEQCNYGAYSTSPTTEWLLFVNDDIIVKTKYLIHLKNIASMYGADVVGAKLLYPNNTLQHLGVYFSHKELLPFHPYLKKPASSIEHSNIDGEVPAVTGAFLFIKKKLFVKIGGFNTKFINGFEDVDLCLKCRDAGAKIALTTAPNIIHYEKQSRGSNDTKFKNNLALLKQLWPKDKIKDLLKRHQLSYTLHNTIPKTLSPYSVERTINQQTTDIKKTVTEVKKQNFDDNTSWPYDPSINDKALKILIHIPIGINDSDCINSIINLDHGKHLVDVLFTYGNPIPSNYDDSGKESNIQILYDNLKYKFDKMLNYARHNGFDYILNIEHDMIVYKKALLDILNYAHPNGLVSGLYRCRPSKNAKQPLAFTITHPQYPNRSKFLELSDIEHKRVVTPLRNICYGFLLIGSGIFMNHNMDGCDGKFSTYCFKNNLPTALIPSIKLGHKDRDGVIIWP